MGTRERLLAVAKNCFACYGFHGTSVDRIVREAGVSKGALYWHFPGKFEIYRAVMEAQALELIRFFEPTSVLAGEDPVTFLIRRGGEQLELFDSDPDLACLWKNLQIEAMRGNEEFQTVARGIWATAIDYLFPTFLEAFQTVLPVGGQVRAREMLETLGACFEGLALQMGIVRDLEESKRLWALGVRTFISGRQADHDQASEAADR